MASIKDMLRERQRAGITYVDVSVPASTAANGERNIRDMLKERQRAGITYVDVDAATQTYGGVDFSKLDQNVLARMKSDYQSGWTNAYDVLNPDDFSRRSSKQMPSSYAQKYEDTDIDRYLLEQGLPSYSQFSRYYYDAENALAKEKRQGEYSDSVLSEWKNLGATTGPLNETALKNAFEAVKKKYGEDYTNGITYADLLEALQIERQNVGAARMQGEVQRIALTNRNRYNEYQAQDAADQAEQQRLQGYDIPAAQAEQAQAKKDFTVLDWIRANANASRYPSYVDVAGNTEAARAEQAAIKARTQEIRNATLAQQSQQAEQYANLKSNADFAVYVQKGAELYNKRASEQEQMRTAETVMNMGNTFFPGAMSDYTVDDKADLLKRMTSEELANYQYLLGKYGEDEADKYYKALQEGLISRTSDEMAATLKKAPILDVGASFVGGLQRAGTGLAQNLTDEVLPEGAFTQASQKFGQTIQSGVGKIAHDLGDTVGNMIPSILMGSVNPALGAATIGLGAGGNAYADARREGNTEEQARAYGWISGASEAALQYLLGGIGKLGGKAAQAVTPKLTKVIQKIVSNENISGAIARLVSSAGGEFTEEYLQEILAPVFRNIALDENNEFKPFTEEALYAGMLGAITGIFFEGADVFTAPRQKAQAAARTQEAPAVQSVEVPAAAPVEASDYETIRARLLEQAKPTAEPVLTLEQRALNLKQSKAIAENEDAFYEQMLDALEKGETARFNRLQDQWREAQTAGSSIDQQYEQALPQLYEKMISALESGDDVAAGKASREYYTVLKKTGAANPAEAFTRQEEQRQAALRAQQEAERPARELEQALQEMRQAAAAGDLNALDNAKMNYAVKLAAAQKALQSGQNGGIMTQRRGANGAAETAVQGNSGLGIQTRPERAGVAGSAGNAQANPSEQGSTQSRAGVQRSDGGNAEVEPSAQVKAALQKYIENKTTREGKKATARFVRGVPSEIAEIADEIKSLAGNRIPDVHFYESDDDFSGGFTDGRAIYVRIGAANHIAFTLGHEIAHNMPDITAAGLVTIKKLAESEDVIAKYKAYRAEHASSSDDVNINLKRELIADMYGVFMYNSYAGQEVGENGAFGLDSDAVRDFQKAFHRALSGEALDESVQDVQTIIRGVEDATEHSRVTFEADGREYSYAMPTIKKKADGTFYADFTVDGESIHLEDRYQEDLEDEIKRLKQESKHKNASREVKELREATKLYRDRVSVEKYYENGGDNHNVAKLLRGIYLRNGYDQGGAMADVDLFDVAGNLQQWKDLKSAELTLSTPQRVFENLENWRSTKSKAARALNYLAGEKLKSSYWGFIKDQGANGELWMREEAKKVADVYDGNQRTSTLAQMLGEGIITEQEAANAIYDVQSMIVQAKHATYVFGIRGELKAFSSGDQLVIFDADYRRRLKQAQMEIAKLIEKRDPKISEEAHLKGVREAYQAALNRTRPIIQTGRIDVTSNYGSVSATLPSGEKLATIYEKSKPNMESVRKLSGALKDFYARVFIKQNGVLTENGYAPIRHIKDYFPHLRRETHGVQDVLAAIRGDAEMLSTAVSGLTPTFTPGKPYVTHMLERMGDFTEYDAVRGFNRYLKASANLMYYTPAIQRIRQLEKHVRGYSGGSKNSALAAWLHNYGNILANKKSDLDRGFEDMVGRAAYTVSDKLTGLIGGSSVAGNVSSALSNFISFLNSVPGLEQRQIPMAMVGTFRSAIGRMQGETDYFADKFPSLVRRFGKTEDILTSKLDKAKRAGSKVLGLFFDVADRFSFETVARAKYAELMRKGFTEEAAIQRTDDFLIKMFAERTKGMTPTLFNSKTLKPFIQFQLESLNQLSHFRDLGRQDIAEQVDAIIAKNGGREENVNWTAAENEVKATGKTAWRMVYYLVLMSLWGELTRKLLGRDQTWNPYGMAKDVLESEEPLAEIGELALDNLPFLSAATGGRTPLAGGLDKVATAVETALDPETSAQERAMAALKGAAAFMPGGAQAVKTIEGLSTVSQGGSYTQDAQGRDRLRFRTDQTAGDYLQAGVFGQWALPEAREYIEGGFKPLSVNATDAYKQATKHGIDGTQFLSLYERMAKLKTDEERRRLLFKVTGFSASQKKLIDSLLLRSTRNNQPFTADYSNATAFENSLNGG